MMTKILLLGNTGQVGWELHRSLLTLGELVALDYPEIDMADPASIRSVVREHQPNLIVNATAYTDVDKAESEPELAMAINGTGPGILAEEAQRLNGALIHYSTDYVFDGTKGEPYTEEDDPNPINVYGETKLAGERAVQEVGGAYLIFRTSWVYSLRRPCFVTKVLQWAQEQETLRIVDDQISSPTWARTLAEATAQIIAQGRGAPVDYIQEKSGLYHLTDGGYCSRYEWAKSVLEMDPKKNEQIAKEALPVKSNTFSTLAKRPKNTKLSINKFKYSFLLTCPDWKFLLKLCLSEL
ncbi:MAG: dTDP-4-dehydrorhamnose reductase [Chloroflexota bacterium]|nr:dTDP-4-dehydrorhamnose reductase [Chloroflexota bacterium]